MLPSRFDTADDEQQVPSINQLQGELNLARGSGGAADFSEAGSLEGVRGQPHVTMLKMLKNSARNCRSSSSIPLERRPNGVFLISAKSKS